MQATMASFLAGRMGSWPSRNSWAKCVLACCASSMALMESPRASLPAQASPAVREWASSTPMGRKWLRLVDLIALLVIGGGLLWHTGGLHRISNQEWYERRNPRA